MKEKYLYLVYSLVIILLLVIAGCIAPPSETPSTPVDLYNPNQFAKNNSNATSYVSEVTLSDYTPSTINPSDIPRFFPQPRFLQILPAVFTA